MSDVAILIIAAVVSVAAVGFVVVQAGKQWNRELTSLFSADEAAHVVTLAPTPKVTFVPDGFTCLRCYENPALPERVWCAVCAPVVAQYPAEPIERGGLR